MDIIVGIVFGIGALWLLPVAVNPDKRLHHSLDRVAKELIGLLALLTTAFAIVLSVREFWPALTERASWHLGIGLALCFVIASILIAAKERRGNCRECGHRHVDGEME